MDFRENMAPEIKDVQNSCSWIPTTPAKPDSTVQQPICTDEKGKDIDASQLDPEQYSRFKQDNHANWFETGRLLNNLPQETQCLAIPTCYNSTNSVNVSWVSDNWQGNQCTNSQVHEDLCVNDKFTINNNKWNNLSFGNLLAVAHAHSLPGAKSYVELHSPPQMSTGESSIPTMTMCKFHSSTRANTNSITVKSVLSPFEPWTPDKLGKAGCESAMSQLSEGKIHVEDDARVNEILRDKVKESQSCATNSTQPPENHKPDKEGAEETDLRKTPNPKPRKKRHRPKVIVEGQPKKTHKPTAENQALSSSTTKVKRKYVRRKGANNLINTPLEEGKRETDSNRSPPKPSTENPAFSSSPTKVKRKYVRKIGVNHLNNTSLEGVKSETDSNKSPNSKDTPIEKRKYVRKKGINKPEATELDVQSIDAANEKLVRHTRNSCRRFLNFDLENPDKGKCSSYHPSSNQDIKSQENPNAEDHLKATMQCRHRMEVTIEKTAMGVTYESTCFTNQALKDYQSKPERHSPNLLPHAKMCPLQDDYTFTDERVATRGRCQILFSDVTHDKEENAVQVTINPDCQLTSSIPNDSNCRNSKCLNTERNERTYKRQRVDSAVTAEICSTNAAGIFCNSSQTCGYKLSPNTDQNDGTPSMHFPIFYNNGKTEMGHNTITCSLQSTMIASGNNENLENHPLRDTTTTVKKQLNMCDCNGFINLMGSPVDMKFRYVSTIDAITEQLNKLDLEAERNPESARDHRAIVAYETYYQEKHALVPYQRGGAVIPFDNSFDRVKRRRPRPKVELDGETIRVWQLLLENINSEGIDGNDEEKTKWWEEERRVFSGRADSFIARMHLVQGDRRFSPWKGSVLDSVVGVFLTQNVSDHLSSSAFMSLVAQFPLKSMTNSTQLREEKVDTHTMEPEKYVLNPNETSGVKGEVLNKEACGEDSEAFHEFEGSEIKAVSRVGSSGSSFDGIKPEDNFGGLLADTSKHCPFAPHTSALNDKLSSIETIRDTVDALTSQSSVTSSHSSTDSPIAQTTERTSLLGNTDELTTTVVLPNRFINPTFVQLLQMAESNCVFREVRNFFDIGGHMRQDSLSFASQKEIQSDDWTSPAKSVNSCGESSVHQAPTPGGAQESECYDLSKLYGADSRQRLSPAGSRVSTSSESEVHDSIQKFTGDSSKEEPKLCSPNGPASSNDKIEINKKIIESQKGQDATEILFQENNCNTEASKDRIYPQNLMNATGSRSHTENSEKSKNMEDQLTMNYPDNCPSNNDQIHKKKGRRIGKEKEDPIDWDILRKQAEAGGRKREKTPNTMDSVDWEAVRCADVSEIAHTIRERGMNNRLAERIQDFLNRLVREHGSLDLEWLRDIPPDKAKEYLLSVKGLGLKSVECVRLLTLHHLAFPVDTNVGRIAVRLGWVPLQPLPESLQLHLLEMYPIMESIQKYLWPRLCKLDQKILYELHYQMITFGKVFCTKSKPNCNACPMRGECRHFASAFASARLALPAPEEKSIALTTENREANQNPTKKMNLLQLPSPQPNQIVAESEVRNSQPIIEEPTTPEPTVEAPATPEPSYNQVPECDIENSFCEDPDEIPTIQLNMEEFTHNLRKIMTQNAEILEGETSKAIVALTPEAALIPLPKLKNVSQLRTEHQVYELPDSHPLLEGMDRREADDPCPYLLAIWTPGETVNSIEPPERRCSSQESQKLCNDETCLSCNSVREENSLTVRGTLLIPCRTAMRGSFPLNGTYFQVNEVFSDHESSLHPMDIPRKWLWNLPRRTVYFGTSIPTIFKGLATEDIQYCFWRGFVCVRGFDRKTRAPRPLIARLHFPASKLAKRKGETGQN